MFLINVLFVLQDRKTSLPVLGVLVAAWLQTFGIAELIFWFQEQVHDAELQGFPLSPLLTPSMELFCVIFHCSAINCTWRRGKLMLTLRMDFLLSSKNSRTFFFFHLFLSSFILHYSWSSTSNNWNMCHLLRNESSLGSVQPALMLWSTFKACGKSWNPTSEMEIFIYKANSG